VTEGAFGQLVVRRDGDEWVLEATGGETIVDIPPDPDAIRERVRFDIAGRYRPLPGALTLPGGWRARCYSEQEARAVLDAVYPLAADHEEQRQAGLLRLIPLEAVLERQTGRYRVARKLDDEGRSAARRSLCGLCAKAPLWAGASPSAGSIPCPEPCSAMVALCREAALWQNDTPPAAPVDPAIPFADFESPGNEIREDYLRARYHDRRG